MASPTRDPFKAMGHRPSLARQRTMPVNTKRLTSAPPLFTKEQVAAKVKRPASAVPIVATSPTRSPSRKGNQNSGSPVRNPPPGNGFRSKVGNAGMIKVAMRNTLAQGVQGRTLVELQQARAGGIPERVRSAENIAAAAAFTKVVHSYSEPPVWDPEIDEMPSPFLARGRKR
jgi:hypothetical protein